MLIVLLLGVVCGIGAAFIADSKGRSGVGYFFLGFFFSIIGLLIAIGVSDRREKFRTDAASLAALEAKGLVVCHVCGRSTMAVGARCPTCSAIGRAGPNLHGNERKCPACAEWVLKEAKKCKHCGEVFTPEALPAAPPATKQDSIGYCLNCAKLRGYNVPKCIYCGSTGPVIGDAPSPPMTTAPGSRG